jgi:hypothetical protein
MTKKDKYRFYELTIMAERDNEKEAFNDVDKLMDVVVDFVEKNNYGVFGSGVLCDEEGNRKPHKE